MMHNETPVVERRSITRTTINRDALLFFPGQSGPFPCCVRNVTNLGAGIELNGAIALPLQFDVSFDRFRTKRTCRLVWSRHDDFVGVAFTEEAPSNLTPAAVSHDR
jgi:hypothetical protein